MPGELALIEHQLTAVAPRLDVVLGGIMKAPRLIQTVLVSCERTPKLLECTPQSILNGAMTFAVLGLPVDSVSGQGFLMPFFDKYKHVFQAQAVIGYKGYNTLGARAGLTITAGTVREDDDEWKFELGSSAFVHHRPRLGSRDRIIAFWACATAPDRTPIISILSIDDVLAIKAKSPGAKGAGSPWNDPEIGFPAMGEKSARRRLARSTPLRIDIPQFQMAARLEEAFDEQGKLSWITPERGVVVEGDPAAEVLPQRNTETPTTEALLGMARQETVSQPALERTASPTGVDPPRKSAEVGEVAAQSGATVNSSPTDSMIETYLRDTAQQGLAALQDAWAKLTPPQQHKFKALKDRHLKPMALEADQRRGT